MSSSLRPHEQQHEPWQCQLINTEFLEETKGYKEKIEEQDLDG